MSVTIRSIPASDAVVSELVRRHHDYALANTPPGSVHAVEPASADLSDLTYWVAFIDATPAGCVALKALAPDHGEIKSMHTVAAFRGRGIAGALLARVEAEARQAGMTRLSLETGNTDGFAAARRLYERHGYTECPPFGPYVGDPHSHCMIREL